MGGAQWLAPGKLDHLGDVGNLGDEEILGA